MDFDLDHVNFSSSGRERWDRLATGTLWTGVLLVAITVYSAFDGDDVYGLANTLLPGLLCLGMWRLAVWRRDR